MTVILQPLPAEISLGARPVPDRWAEFRFGYLVTAEAVYVPVPKRRMALFEPLEPRRLPVDSIRRVVLSEAPWFTGRFLFLAPFFLFNAFMAWLISRDGGQSWNIAGAAAFIFGLPLVRTVLGSGGRFHLAIVTPDETFSFLPTADSASTRSAKATALQTQLSFIAAARLAGLSLTLPEGTPPPA